MKKICEQCGDEFEPKRPDAKYCSPKCRTAASRKSVPAMDIEAIKNSDMKYEPDKKVPYDYEANLAAFKKMGMVETTWITTGIPDFDALTQIPRGRVTQIQGPYGVGKTTLCLNMIHGLKGHRILYIDTEAALNPRLLAGLGVVAKYFTLYNDSAFIEDIYELIIAAVEHAKYDMIIFDSLASTTFRTEAANSAADSNIGQKARIVNKLMRIVPMELKRTNTALVIINQEREFIGGYVPQKYTPGGMGVPFAASLMIALKTTKGARFPKSGPPFKGHEVTAEIIKSKVNDPWRKATFKLYYGALDGSTQEKVEAPEQAVSDIDSSSSSPDNKRDRKLF